MVTGTQSGTNSVSSRSISPRTVMVTARRTPLCDTPEHYGSGPPPSGTLAVSGIQFDIL